MSDEQRRLPKCKSFDYSLIEHCSVSGKDMALGLKCASKHSSKTQRVYRFFKDQIFNYLKSSGFDIEKTHITYPNRFVKLVAVCAIASALIIKNGLIQNEINLIKIRNHKNKPRLLVSFFTYGFDHIRHCLTKAGNKAAAVIKRILEYDSALNFDRFFSALLQIL